MNTRSVHTMLYAIPTASADESAQPYIYSFRCSQGMEECLSRLMRERGLNRTSVIRLALYALDCFSRRLDVQQLTLSAFVQQLEQLAPEPSRSFEDFIRGSHPHPAAPASTAASAGWIPPAAEPATPAG